eukprot:3638549-Amphidinium_carterae.1
MGLGHSAWISTTPRKLSEVTSVRSPGLCSLHDACVIGKMLCDVKLRQPPLGADPRTPKC